MVIRSIISFFLLCSALYAGEVQLFWTAPGDDGQVGTATQYDIRYYHELIRESNWHLATIWDNPPIPEIAGTRQTVIITGLIEGQSYYFAIKTVDDAGNWSELSNVIVKSPSAEVINPPRNLEWRDE